MKKSQQKIVPVGFGCFFAGNRNFTGIILLLLLYVFTTASCKKDNTPYIGGVMKSSPPGPIEGKWDEQYAIFNDYKNSVKFYSDTTYYKKGSHLLEFYEGNKLRAYTNQHVTDSGTYTYSNNKLMFTNGKDSVVFTTENYGTTIVLNNKNTVYYPSDLQNKFEYETRMVFIKL